MKNHRNNITYDIKRISCGIILFCSFMIADNFLMSTYAQAGKTSNGKEISINDEKVIASAVWNSISKTKAFPIPINYPDEQSLLTKGHILLKSIGFSASKQALVLENSNGTTEFIYFVPIVPHTTQKGDVINSIFINSINYDSETDKFTMNADCKWEGGNAIREVLGKVFKGENMDLPLGKVRIGKILSEVNKGGAGIKQAKTAIEFIEELPINEERTEFLKVRMSNFKPTKK